MNFKIKGNEKKLLTVLVAVFFMGFTNSLLTRCTMGNDPCTFANLGISKTIGWTFGNWQLLFNTFLLVFCIIFCRNQMGWGTLANMILVGYSYDLTTWIENKIMPETLVNADGSFKSMGMKIGVMIPVLILFIFFAALYMAVQLGTAPYDALSYLIAEKSRLPFRPVRIAYDSFFAVVGIIFGGKIGVVTIAMCLCLGPAVQWMHDNVIEKIFGEGKKSELSGESGQ